MYTPVSVFNSASTYLHSATSYLDIIDLGQQKKPTWFYDASDSYNLNSFTPVEILLYLSQLDWSGCYLLYLIAHSQTSFPRVVIQNGAG